MKEIFKKMINHSVLNHILVALGIIGMFDWIIAPALTAPSTIFNVAGLLAAMGVCVFIWVYIKETFFND